MNPQHIHTLAALKEERIRLRIHLAATRKELYRSAESTVSLGRQFVFKKVVLPAGAAGLGIVAAQKIFSSSRPHEKTSASAESHSGHWLLPLLAATLPMLSQYFLNREEEDDDETMDFAEQPDAPDAGNSSFALLFSALMPLAISWLQQWIDERD